MYGSDMDRVFYSYDITLLHHGQKMKSIVYDMPMNTVYFFVLTISLLCICCVFCFLFL